MYLISLPLKASTRPPKSLAHSILAYPDSHKKLLFHSKSIIRHRMQIKQKDEE